MTVLYEVKTGHTKEVLKAFTRIFMKMESWKTTFYFGVVAAVFYMIPKAFTVPTTCKYLCWSIGTFIVLFALFRPYLILSNLMARDKYFINHTEITMSFGNSEFKVLDGEIREYRYYTIRSMFQDEKMLYLEMDDKDLFIIPKSDFVQGTADEFCEFMARTTEQKVVDFNDRFPIMIQRKAKAS